MAHPPPASPHGFGTVTVGRRGRSQGQVRSQRLATAGQVVTQCRARYSVNQRREEQNRDGYTIKHIVM